ncbi:hypothetical protein BO71DRAFT_460265 [Aspergillus ellipticus CBS 707.79]|uniref:DNA mismatch repair protein S5 domain-containing protein n=1 Tax=Aspergillus ellipticus CBS 707.79 TaxID=1448320 RepID=A0A319D251_9EURO|nr:hypothetical protein BO71DRAFT_460265 [Aspergillus ellipticus CBS 707.79]
MPIAALPPTTVQAIGSASVLSDPCAVVKELLDNALDASATAVFIEISANTVDLIQVKDNGRGIPATDHPAVCKRTFTSKIQTVDDLRSVGGKSLGFRGEALASAAEISGGLTVGTRVEDEPVGASVRYDRNGELLSTQHASHPVGTSVRITDLFKHIPVRRQTVLKNTAKTLVKIKKLVQAYAVAQPSKRLSLRVLKAKNENNNWMYAPVNAKILEAALKIVGADVVSSCLVREWPTGGESQTKGAFQLVAVLPDPQSDLFKTNGLGQYISIDGRPLSAARGIARDIAKLYKSYIRSVASRQEPSPNITDPLLCLHVRCTEASYDVNVEPAKDDVLFEDPQELLSLAEDLLCSVYGPTDRTEKPKAKEKEPVSYKNPFDLLLARKSPDSQPKSHATSFVSARFAQADADTNAENRMFATVNPRPKSIPTPVSNRVPRIGLVMRSPENRRDCSRSFLPSPSASADPQTSPGSTRPGLPTQGSPDRQRSLKPALRERDKERYGSGALDTWFAKTTLVGLTEPVEERPLNELAQERFGPSTQESVVTTSPEIHATGPEPTVAARDAELHERHAGLPVLERWSARLHQLSKSGQKELEAALDFEKRKREAIASRREQLKPSSPHLSRYLAARAALQPEAKPVLSPHDPRSYLLMRQRAQNETPGNLKRINTSKLPFENIPAGCELHDVGLTQPATLNIAQTDLYAQCGGQFEGFTATDDAETLVDLWGRRLTGLMEGSGDLQFDFSHLGRRLRDSTDSN